ncbi:MAG: hypothetical protein Q4F72_09805, partial [Desulfovibrionaceae bacterium]|nr:hypothetical protein [Desulfovibrionaceae bacterium]
HGFRALTLRAGDFVLKAWLRPGRGDLLHVYIEGDGHAWQSRTRPSSDPTPWRPTGFFLAASDPTENPVLYLGRPCQYVGEGERMNCTPDIWTSARYSERVVSSLDAAAAQVMRMTGAARTAWYGFSGGGALAALLAERHPDTVFIGTAAANLDTDAWTDHHGVSRLRQSLNPAGARLKTAGIAQVHLSGGEDRVCPPFLARNWCRDLPSCESVLVPDLRHGGAWEEVWPLEMNARRRLRQQ